MFNLKKAVIIFGTLDSSLLEHKKLLELKKIDYILVLLKITRKQLIVNVI